jgi:hypothetical protein
MSAFDPLRTLKGDATFEHMTLFASAMKILFLIAWGAALLGWIYGTRFYLPWRFRKSDGREGYGRKALIGYGIFVAAIIFGFLVGGLAELAGGWE